MTLLQISTFEKTEENLNLPDLPEEFLNITFTDDDEGETEEIIDSYPFAASDVTLERILNAKKLTNAENVKEIYSIELSSSFSSFKPGDTIGIITHNREDDVTNLFKQLGIINQVKRKCKIYEKSMSKKKNPIKPIYLDKITTIEYIFFHFVDLRCIPKKILIRVLAEFTKDLKEKRKLEELCSKEMSELYVKNVLEMNQTFLDLLFQFPSCCPPVLRLLENLPKLLPRPYSIASSPLSSPNRVRIVFSVVKNNNGILREGLCTGMLKGKINKVDKEELQVKLFLRKCNGFNLPDNDVPLILIGPGTGIAPFIGFLEHQRKLGRKRQIWLFFGCRYKEGDYLFKKELEEFLDCGVLTNLSVAFSRDTHSSAKYVQDNIRKHGKKLCTLITEENAAVYVCGDAKNMRKDVQNAVTEILKHYKGMTNEEAQEFVKKLQKGKRYLQDIWL